ncbi:carbamoyl phosphate synthase [Aeribacillus pallidus]|nr:carbamoyl phosphate synthase [Aeribacillus pallidus]
MYLNSVLITGCAGDIGLGISTILREIPWINKIYGTDINDQFPAEYFYDAFFKVPRVTQADYIEVISDLVKKHNIELIIPVSEPELRFFYINNIKKINGVQLLMPSFNIMEIGFDKLHTANYLRENGYPFPWTVEVSEGNPLEIPCIIKSRDGSGSKTVNIVRDDNLSFYKNNNNYKNFIFQELLLPDDEEYTCGVFRTKKGISRTIIFKRVLAGGRTGYAEVVKNDTIEKLLISLSKNINFQGSVNFQLRMTKKGPIIFEINPRFSSTVVFRHKLGFKDVQWAILDLYNELKEEHLRIPNNIVGKKIFRADKEIIF